MQTLKTLCRELFLIRWESLALPASLLRPDVMVLRTARTTIEEGLIMQSCAVICPESVCRQYVDLPEGMGRFRRASCMSRIKRVATLLTPQLPEVADMKEVVAKTSKTGREQINGEGKKTLLRLAPL